MPRKTHILPILLLFITSSIFLNSCRKETQITTSVYVQNKGFFTRSTLLIHADLSEGFIQSNNTSSIIAVNKNDVIDTILTLLKEEDLKKQFINKIVDKYGYAQWNYSLILKNENGLKTVITPIIDSTNKVKSIILAYQQDINKADFKIIDRKTKQTKLPYYGDRDAKTLTQVSLEGIFQSLEKKINQVNNTSSNATLKSNDATKSNGVQFSFECWYYVSYDYMSIAISNTQCSLSIIFTPSALGNIQWDESLIPSNSSYAAPNPPSVDPVYDCNCNCTEEDPLETLASTVYEPKWGQLGTLTSIILEMNKILVTVPNYYSLSFQAKLESHKNYFDANRSFARDQNNNIIDAPNSKKIDRYLYTYSRGWIDMHHFFYTAFLSEKYLPGLAYSTTLDGEAIQFLKNSESAFSYEDIPSNVAGIHFYKQYGDAIKNGNISLETAVKDFFVANGATLPSNAPNYDYIPHIIDNFFPTNHTVRGLTGSALYNAAREAFCKKPAERKQKIKEAHSTINHSSN